MMLEHIKGDWIWSVLVFYIYSALVQTMPPPLPGSRWYAWLFNFLQVLGANIKEVLGNKATAVVTTTKVEDSEGVKTITEKVQEVKVDTTKGIK